MPDDRDREIETLRNIALLARTVLERQKTYFKTRDRGDLIASKQAEKALAAALQAWS